MASSFPCLPYCVIALAWALSAGTAPLRAKVCVTLAQPSVSQESGDLFLFKPRVEGVVVDSGYYLAVAENGKLLARFTWPAVDPTAPGPGGLQWTGLMAAADAGVDIALSPDGALVLCARCRDAARTFQVRATSREQPSAFRTVTLRMTCGAGAPAAETKAGISAAEAKATLPQEIPRTPTPPSTSHIWPTPFTATRPPCPFTASTWDPSTKPHSIVIWSNEKRLVRRYLDGRSEVLLDESSFDPWTRTCLQLSSMAVSTTGDLVFLETGTPRLWRLNRGKHLQVLAGNGQAEDSGNYEEEGNQGSLPALEAGLGHPQELVACADGGLAFSDKLNGRICRLTPDGRLETLVGGPRARAQDLDLNLSHPAQAFRLRSPACLASTSDGTLLFVVDATRIGALAPDGCILMLPYRHPRPIQHLAVTPDQEIIFADLLQEVWLLDRNAQPVPLAYGRVHDHWSRQLLEGAHGVSWGMRNHGIDPFQTGFGFTVCGFGSHEVPLIRQPVLALSRDPGSGLISRLETVPGGILLSFGAHSQVAFMGPRQTDHLLVERIALAAAAVEAGQMSKARRIWSSLKEIAKADPDSPGTLPDLHVGPLARSRGTGLGESGSSAPHAPGAALRSVPDAAPLPQVLQAQIAQFLPDYRALALRAQIAMHLLERKMKAACPETWAQVVASPEPKTEGVK